MNLRNRRMEHTAILHRTSVVVWLWRSRYAREMATGITPSEQFVFHVCRESFLSLWSCANPRGKTAGKELTDILVVCDPDIVLVSAKEIGLSKTDDPIVQWQRWRKKAIEESADQLYGAERVGLATEQYEQGKGHSLDLVCLHQETWTAEDQQRMAGIQKDLGYFVNPTQTTAHEDEYPTTKP